MDGEDLKVRLARIDDGRPHLEGQRVVADHARAVLDQELGGVEAGSRGERSRIQVGIVREVWAPAGADEHGVALFQANALALCRLLQVCRGDLEFRGQWAQVALDHLRHVEKDAAVHQEVGRELVDREVGADSARPDPVRVARCGEGIQSAE